MRFRKKSLCGVITVIICISLLYHLSLLHSNSLFNNLKSDTTILLTTQKCKQCIKLSLKLLQESRHFAHVWVVNNGLYNEKDLTQWYPAVKVEANSYSYDVGLRHALEKFVISDFDWMIYIASDMLIANDWWNSFLKVRSNHPQAVISLYQPSDVQDPETCEEYCLQRSLNDSGTAWSKTVAVRLLDEMKKHKDADGWKWSKWCFEHGILLVSLQKPVMTRIDVNYLSKTGSLNEPETNAKALLVGSKSDNTNKLLLQKDDEISRKKSAMEKINPVYVKGSSSSYNKVPCDVPCFWTSTSGLIRTVTSEKYTFKLSMEGSHYYSSLRKGKGFMGTTSFESEIPLPYYNWTWTRFLDKPPDVKDVWSDNNIQTQPKGTIPRVLFMARNCRSSNNREKVIRELYDIVDSVSSCLRNKNVGTVRNKHTFMENYMFYAAFENGCVNDYVTEKLWGAFAAGTLPIVYGPPNIWDHVPAKSILNVADFSSIKSLQEHVEYLVANRTAYDEYHAWRRQPLPNWFVAKYNFTHVHSACRLCRWVAAKRDGLKWDPVQQEIIL